MFIRFSANVKHMNVLFITPSEVLYSKDQTHADAVKFLKNAKKKYALVALTDDAQDVCGTELEEHDLLGYFELIASSKDYDTRLPDYRIINISLATLRDKLGEEITKRECALLGARPYEDIKCGNDAGIKTIRVMMGCYVNTDPEDASEKPTAKVSDLKEASYLLAPEEMKKPNVLKKAAPKKAKAKRAIQKKKMPAKPAKKKAKQSKAKTKAAPKQAKRSSKKEIEESFF